MPDREPQLEGVGDYRMVIDVAGWESHQLVSMIMGILLSEHIGYDVIFNYAPLVSNVNRLLVPLSDDIRRREAFDEKQWLWDTNAKERLPALGKNLACVADSAKRFAVVNMEVWNMPTKGDGDWVGRGYVTGDRIGYHGQSGWFIPAVLSQEVGSLWSTYKNLRGQVPQAWREAGFTEDDLINCANASLSPCFPQRGNATDPNCRMWCARREYTIPLWAPTPTYDAGYSEEIIYNNDLSISIQYVGTEEHEKKVVELFNNTDGSPGSVLFYSWEPSTLINRVRELATSTSPQKREDYEVSRLFLPNSVCRGPHMDVGPPDSKYRCDFPQQYLAKLLSKNVEAEAPFAFDFLTDFEITQGQIEDMLTRLVASNQYSSGNDETRRQEIFKVACNWVKSASRRDSEDMFYWPKYTRAKYWYTDLGSIGSIILRNTVFASIIFVCIILVERVWITSSLNLNGFVCSICTTCQRYYSSQPMPFIRGARSMIGRVGSSIRFSSAHFLQDRSTTRSSIRSSFNEGEVRQAHNRDNCDSYGSKEADFSSLEVDSTENEELGVQVCAETMWCKETEESITIGVFLSQAWMEQVSIGFCTEDGSAKAGERYKKHEGEIVFEPSERVKSVDIKILDSQDWDAGTYFDFNLQRTRPEHLEPGCSWKTRVHIIDTDDFPKSKSTSDEARRRMSRRKALFEHFWNEYIRLRVSCWLAVSARVYCAVHESLILPLVEKFMLDEAVGRSRVQTNHKLVLILGAVFFAAQCCRRVAETFIVKYSKVAGVSAELEIQLYNKLWVINSMTRDTRIQPSKWISALMRHAQDVASDGWAAVFELVQEFTCLILIVFVTFALGTDFFKDDIGFLMAGPPVLLLTILPLAWWLVVEVRKEGQIKNQEELDTRITRVYNGFNWLLNPGKDLVRLGRGKSSHYLEERRRHFRRDTALSAQAFVAANLYKLDSGWVAMWMAVMVHVCFFITGSYLLIESKHYGQGALGVGTFVAMLRNLSSFGRALRGIFGVLLRIENASYALHRIAELLNSPTEEAGQLERQRAELKTYFPGNKSLDEQMMDTMYFKNVTFGYAERADLIITNLEAALPLGRIICLKDDHSSANQRGGQSTLLRLLAGDLLPTGGQVLLPPHLRVGIVETTPALIGDTVLNNITVLAVKDSYEAASSCRGRLKEEAWLLAERLGMEASATLLDAHAIPTTCYIATTARVMLSDPDVLIVLTSRWQGGAWLGKFMNGLVRWQRDGLQALLGRNRPKDRARRRTLLMTADTSGLEHLKVGDVYEIGHVEDDLSGVSRSFLTAPQCLGEAEQDDVGLHCWPPTGVEFLDDGEPLSI